MSYKVKDINIKKQSYYFFGDIININNFDSSNIKTDKKPYKNILIQYIEYIMIKDSEFIKVNSENPSYLIFNKVNGCFEKMNKSKYLTLVPTNESKENIKKYKELWIKIKYLTRSINYMKII